MNMGRFALLAPALLTSSLTAAAAAGYPQDVQPAVRMVQAFRDYCINTDPTHIHVISKALGKGFTWGAADGTETAVWTVPGDPEYLRKGKYRTSLAIVRVNGVPRECMVLAAYPEKAEIIEALAAVVALGEANSTVDGHNVEITRWTIRAHGASAVVQLRIPAWTGLPGRSLKLILGR